VTIPRPSGFRTIVVRGIVDGTLSSSDVGLALADLARCIHSDTANVFASEALRVAFNESKKFDLAMKPT
jgi:hypothetical protein